MNEKNTGDAKGAEISVHLCIDGNIKGPFDLAQLVDLYKESPFSKETLCCVEGGSWKKIHDLPLIDTIKDEIQRQNEAQDDEDTGVVGMSSAANHLMSEDGEDYSLLNNFLQSDEEYLKDDSPIITCPHCWNEFHLSQVNYIANHPTLMGDDVLGEGAQMRFLPSKFNAQGYAIDSKGMVCRDMACPRCHLKIPEIVLEEKVDVLSIVGAPASGKSYYITALTSMLKRNLPEYFNYTFVDADVNMNYTLNHYEDLLFHNVSGSKVALPKTELEGANFSSRVNLDGFTVNLPLPYIFTLRKVHDTTARPDDKGFMHNVVMYDNAGEHFEAGRESVANLATMHLINSSLIMFLFDPFKDSRAIKSCSSDDPQANVALRSINQVQILREMINRIKKYRGMASYEKSDKLLTILVPKYDAWASSFPFDLKDLSFTYFDKSRVVNCLNLGVLKLISYSTRQWLLQRVPEVVTDSEAFFETVFFLPVSALGTSPEYDSSTDMIGINPDNINPIWCDVPIYLYLWRCGLVPAVETGFDVEIKNVEGFFKNGNYYLETIAGRPPRMVPSLYMGATVYDGEIGAFVRIPVQPSETDNGENEKETEGKDSFWD